MADTPEWDALVRGFCVGDPVPSREFWNRFGEPLRRMAQTYLEKPLARRVAAEDVVQSVCRTFFRRLQHGLLALSDQESLWRLLCAITLNKIREHRRFHLRKKRSMNSEESLSTSQEGDWAIAAKDPGPEVALEWAEQMELLLDSLDEEQRQIVDLRLQGNTQEEIAATMRISERTVRRLTKVIQAHLLRMLNARDAFEE